MRILGIGLLVALLAGALGAGAAQAKTSFTPYTWGQFAHCPYEDKEITDCFYGATNGGKTGGFFEYGRVQVKLTKPILIQGGFKNVSPNVEVMAPTDAAGLLESPEEPVTKGLKVITKKIQAEAEWPEALKAAFAEAVENKETKATATVEMAGNECTTVPGCLNTESLIFEEPSPPAFRLPLKVTVKSAFLDKLGGGPCTIGSDELPIQQHLVSSGPGRAGDIEFNEPAYTVTQIKNSKLTDTNWHITKAQGAKGCGGEYEAYVNRALNIALEVEFANGIEPSNKSGITILTGSLFDGASSEVLREHEEGNPELP